MNGEPPDPARKRFYAALAALALVGAFALGLYSGISNNRLSQFLFRLKHDMQQAVDEAPNLVRPIHFLQPARYPGEGVTLNRIDPDDGNLVLLSGFFGENNEIRLLRRDGHIVARWITEFSAVFPDPDHLRQPPATDWNIDLHGVMALPDGSVIFNFEYGGTVKMDRCSEVVWTLAATTHHSVEPAQDGGFWIPGRRYHVAGTRSLFPPFSPPYTEDTVMQVSADGEILREISVPQLFYANGMEALLTSTGETIHPRDKWDRELVHLNKVAELHGDIAGDFPRFEAGDLVVSLREFNMLMVFDPDSLKVRWWKIGPWKRQHDPRFVKGGKILLFNNNTYRADFGRAGWGVSGLDVPRVSNIMELDVTTDETRILYGGIPQQELLSIERGKVDVTAGGNLLITEFEGGRVLEIDAEGRPLWTYLNRYDNNLVAELSEARMYPARYFDGVEWSCEQ